MQQILCAKIIEIAIARVSGRARATFLFLLKLCFAILTAKIFSDVAKRNP
jgi:uncharacterized membrane protein